MELNDGQWTAVSTGVKSPTSELQLLDGYISSIFWANHGAAPYQWVQINFGRKIPVGAICFTHHYVVYEVS